MPIVAVDLTEEDGKPRADPSPKSSTETPVCIDLSGAPPTAFELQNTQYEASLQASLAHEKKRKRTTEPIAHPEDVIDLEALASSSTAKGTASASQENDAYKIAVGPLRMDFCTEFYPAHAFANNTQNSTFNTNKIFQELLEYKLNLPVASSSSIFVRASESRLDLLRVAITGPENTPYAHGVFMFDVYLHDYPESAPQVKFLTTAGGKVRFNPNLYDNGYVCLSLLGTWQGPGWIPNKSTLLQVLVSLQGLVLVPEPFFNEPGYDRERPGMMLRSGAYNNDIRAKTMDYAVRDMMRAALCCRTTTARRRAKRKKDGERLYPEFAEVICQHFAARSEQLRAQIRNWMNPVIGRHVEELLDQVIASCCPSDK